MEEKNPLRDLVEKARKDGDIPVVILFGSLVRGEKSEGC